MKRALALLCTLAMGLALCACGSSGTPGAVISTRGGEPGQLTQPHTTNPPSGNTGPKITGHWQNNSIDVVWGGWDYYHWYLNEDGTFNYFLITTAEYSYKGNYSVSNGKIYFTNVVFTNADESWDKPDSWVDYEIVLNSQGNEELRISNTSGENWMGSPWWDRAD